MKRGTKRRSVLVLLVAVCLALGGGVVSAASAATVPAVKTASAGTAADPDDGWFTSWTQSQQRVSGKVFTNQSMRMITHLSQGGDAARIRLQNQYGTAPVTITQTSLALSAGGPAIVAASSRALTFNGSESVTIPVGGQVWSDPTNIETTAQQDVAVTFYVAGSPVASLHDLAGRNNYGAAANSGNKNSEASGASFTEALPWTYFVSAVDVYNTDLAGTIVAYGSSVVDGTGSDNCGPGCSAFGQNKRWTDDLARRVVAELPASQQVAVVNEGIGATLSSPACGNNGGLDGVSRVDRDVLALHGVTGVIFYYGTNDVGNNCSATDILASYHTIFQKLRDANIKVFVTPVTPRPTYTDAMNAQRATINEFVRAGGDCSGTCDGVLDFDTVLKDPANANSLNPLYDNGDGAHANVAGQQAIADSISLSMLAPAKPLNQILDEIQKTDDHAGDLATAGDLPTDDRTHVGDSLGEAKSKVEDAIAADLDGNAGAKSQDLSDGLAAVRALKAWVATLSIDGPVKSDLTTRLEKLESMFGKGVASSLGVSVVIPPVAAAARTPGTVSGTIEVTNGGDVALSDLDAKVTVEDWKVDPTNLTKDTLAPGDSVQLPFTASVPRHQKPGKYDASVALTFTSSYGTFTVNDTTPWVSVVSGVEITNVSSTSPADGSDERASINATVHNDSDVAVSGQIETELPEGWSTPVASERVTIEPGATKTVTLPLYVGVEAIGGKQAVTVDFVENGVTLASKDGELNVNLTAPPGENIAGQLDHVNFGNTASESAHGIMASPSSGINVEAGLDRRYANASTPGAWYSAEYHVTPGKPFMIRNIETFDGAKSKRYNIYVDGTLVKTYTLKQTLSGQTTKTYQTLIDDPAVLNNDGTVRIKFEYPLNATGYHDPSIADSWVLPVPDDELAPLVSATVAGVRGEQNWLRGDATVTIAASDNRAGAPVVETGESAGWQPYVAPVVVAGDGKHSVSYRAKDAAGNSTGEQKVAVWIDGTAPQTQLAVTRGSGTENADKATLKLTAQDVLSGVASTTYRVDGGDWKTAGADDKPVVEGFGEHTVEFFTTDVAGNAETLRSAVVDLADVDTIAALVAPQITGTASYGSTLTATTGSWNTKGLLFTYQWLRDGKAVSGRTSSTYKLGSSDVGHRLSVRVTASKDGKAPASATSAETAKVTKAKSKVSVSYSDTSVKRNHSVRLSITVSSVVTPHGTVRIYENGKRVKSLTLSSSGKASYSLKMSTKGLRSLKVVYVGSSVIGDSSSTTRHIRVR